MRNLNKVKMGTSSNNPDGNEEVMRWEAERLSTFHSWRHNDKVEAGKIAKAGFFHTGNSDSEVKCLWCGTVLNQWEYGESVMARHRSANPDCPFIKNTSDNVPLNNQQQQISSSQDRAPAESQDVMDTPMEEEEEPQQNGHAPQNQDNLHLYRSEAARLTTFANWPLRSIRPADLANAGFIYTGDNDMVRCVFCGQYVGNWQNEDFPMTEHRVLFPQCPFIRGYDVGNIPVDPPQSNLDLPNTTNQASSPSRPDRAAAMDTVALAGSDEVGIRPHRQAFSGPEKGPNNIRYNGVPPTNEESIGIIKHSGPTNLKYSTVEARLRTFKDWPPALKQEPRQLADAGFYYIGLSDQTKCFYCDGGLRNWQPDDDPWTEHARWFSKCGYVRLIKGDDFIAKCLDERPPEIASTSSAVSTGSKDKAHLSESELRNLMANSSLVKEVLAMGISQARIQIALKQKGKMFPTANELATHALSVQLEEQTIIPNPTESQPNENAQNPGPSTSSAASPPSPMMESTNEELSKSSQDLEQENQRLKEARTCKICMDNEIGVVFLPCGHLICCVQCAPSLRDCPLCRQSIHGTVKTYMS